MSENEEEEDIEEIVIHLRVPSRLVSSVSADMGKTRLKPNRDDGSNNPDSNDRTHNHEGDGKDLLNMVKSATDNWSDSLRYNQLDSGDIMVIIEEYIDDWDKLAQALDTYDANFTSRSKSKRDQAYFYVEMR